MIQKNLANKIIYTISLALFTVTAIIYIMPLMITFSNSLMSGSEIIRNYSSEGTIFQEGKKFIDMNLIPGSVTLSQYDQILFRSPFYLNMFWNSIKITVPVVVGQLIVSSMAAYAFTVLHY